MEKRTIIIMSIILGVLILSMIIYGVVKRMNPESEKITQTNKYVKGFLTIIVVGGIIYGLYFAYKKFNETDSLFSKTYTPDEVWDEIKKRLVFEEGVKGYFDENGKLIIPKTAVEILDQRPFVSTGSGEEFIIFEVHFKDPNICPHTGIRTFVVSLNRDLKYIAGGLYAQHFRSSMFNWLSNKSYLRKLPFTTPQKENLKLAQFAAEQDIDVSQLQNNQQQDTQQPQQYQNYSPEDLDTVGEPHA